LYLFGLEVFRFRFDVVATCEGAATAKSAYDYVPSFKSLQVLLNKKVTQ
jgi:hypothetical protein